MERIQGRASDEEGSVSRSTDQTAAANYRELFQIGAGGFATISIALAQGIEGFNKLVVLKILREEIGLLPSAVKMFMAEARLLARMNHPNIVQVYDVYRRRNAIVIVMEYVDGQPLSTIRSRCHKMNSTVSLELSIAILVRVLAALKYAHTLCDFGGEPFGLIHRDISPQNVMVTYDGQVKLLDFGIAKLGSAQGVSDQTREGVIKGKLTYMAPEQLVGGVDHRVDIFAVGVVLWELATQRRYWADAPETTIMRRLLSGELPHLYDRAGIDDDLHMICSKALSWDVDQRYASAAEMQDDLERYLVKRGISVNQAAIGQLASETCSDLRESVQEAIRSHLSAIKLTRASDVPLTDSLRPLAEPARFGHARLGKISVLTVAGATALLLATAYVRSGRSLQIGAPPRAQPSTTLEGTTRIRASAQPAGAVWYLDDRRIGPDPIDIRVPKDNVGHLLLAEIDGYAPFKRTIRVEEADLDIAAVLVPQHSDVAQTGRATPSPIRRVIASPRTVGNRSATAAATAAAAAVATPQGEAPPTVTVENPPKAKPKQESAPAQFGERLKRPGVNLDRERPGIDMDYPGSGG